MERQIIEGQEPLVDSYEDYEEKEPPSLGFEDIEQAHFRRIQQIPVLTDAEEADLLQRWCEFKDEKARERIILAHMRMVPPIARAAARKAGFEPNYKMLTGTAKWIAGIGFDEVISDLTAAGNEGLMLAIGGFRIGHNVKFYTYARQCVGREIWKQATFLRSAVRRKDGSEAKWDLSIEPAKPDVRHARDNVGSRANPSVSDDPEDDIGDRAATASHTRLAHNVEPKPLPCLDHLLPIDRVIIRARWDGMSLAEIAERLGVSVATIWRKEQRAIARIKAHGNPDCRSSAQDTQAPRDCRLPE